MMFEKLPPLMRTRFISQFVIPTVMTKGSLCGWDMWSSSKVKMMGSSSLSRAHLKGQTVLLMEKAWLVSWSSDQVYRFLDRLVSLPGGRASVDGGY